MKRLSVHFINDSDWKALYSHRFKFTIHTESIHKRKYRSHMRISKIADYFPVEYSLRLPPIAFCRTQADVLTSASFASQHWRGRTLLSDAPQERREMSNKGVPCWETSVSWQVGVSHCRWRESAGRNRGNGLSFILSLRRCQIAHF